MGADRNSIGGNPNIWCNECDDPRHSQEICPNEIYCEDFSAKTVECRTIQVKANEMERILFKIIDLPKQIFSVRIKALKTHDKIQVLEKRELVLQEKKIQVDFKFLQPMTLNTKDLNNLFVCEIFKKLNDDPILNITPPNHEESSNFQRYIAAVKEKRIPWDIFSSLVQDLSKTLQDTKTLNELLLKEWKSSRDLEDELGAELEESRKIIEKFNERTQKINQLAQPQVTKKRLANDDDINDQKNQQEIKKQKNVYHSVQTKSNHKNYFEIEKEIEKDQNLESEEIVPNAMENEINFSGDSDNENGNEDEKGNNLIFSGHSHHENDKGDDYLSFNDEIISNDLETGIKLSVHSDNDKNSDPEVLFPKNETENDNKNTDNPQDEVERHSSNVQQDYKRKSKSTKGGCFEYENESKKISKRFKCPMCSKKFIQKGKLNNHRENKHPNESENDNRNDSKKFQCHVCNKKFTQKGTMNRHTKTLHPNDAQPPTNRRRSQKKL